MKLNVLNVCWIKKSQMMYSWVIKPNITNNMVLLTSNFQLRLLIFCIFIKHWFYYTSPKMVSYYVTSCLLYWTYSYHTKILLHGIKRKNILLATRSSLGKYEEDRIIVSIGRIQYIQSSAYFTVPDARRSKKWTSVSVI